VKDMALPIISKTSCEELCRKRALLEQSINGRNSIDIDKCIKICRERAKQR
jgi:hypothetical protein